MTTTYDCIATTTLSSATSDVTFSSISGNYTDLVLVVDAANTTGNVDLFLRLNGDTGTNYSYIYISGYSAGIVTNQFKDTANVRMGYYAIPQSTFRYNSITHILNYSNITTHKNWITRANAGTSGSDILMGTWRSTSAITSVMVRSATSTFMADSTFSLYGIKAE